MANMGYCRFSNTLEDVKECIEALNNKDIESDGEKKSAKALLELIAEFLVDEDLINGKDVNINYEGIEEYLNNCI